MLDWMRWLPENASTYGADVDGVIRLIWTLTVIWFFLTFGAIGAFLVLYRRREGRRASYVRGDRFREALWILVPVMVVLVLDLWLDHRGAPDWYFVVALWPALYVCVYLA